MCSTVSAACCPESSFGQRLSDSPYRTATSHAPAAHRISKAADRVPRHQLAGSDQNTEQLIFGRTSSTLITDPRNTFDSCVEHVSEYAHHRSPRCSIPIRCCKIPAAWSSSEGIAPAPGCSWFGHPREIVCSAMRTTLGSPSSFIDPLGHGMICIGHRPDLDARRTARIASGRIRYTAIWTMAIVVHVQARPRSL